MARYPEDRFPPAVVSTDETTHAAGFVDPVHRADGFVVLAGDGADAASGAKILACFAAGAEIRVDMGHQALAPFP